MQIYIGVVVEGLEIWILQPIKMLIGLVWTDRS
jgi:hypothetical protein